MQEMEVALEAAREVGELLREAWRVDKVIHFKGAVDLVTDTDRESERRIVDRLTRAFPQHRVLAEESATDTSGRGSQDGWIWFIDPLDGTTNFAHGYPHFAVSIAAARDGELELGVVHDPIRGETFRAQRGGGAFLNDQPIHASTVEVLDQALIGTGFPYDRRERPEYYLAFVADVLRRSQGVRRAGTASLDLSYVACGRLDGFWEFKLKPWDVAAGALILREAGGRVTDCRGGDFSVYGDQILATNGEIHDELATVVGARL